MYHRRKVLVYIIYMQHVICCATMCSNVSKSSYKLPETEPRGYKVNGIALFLFLSIGGVA